MRLFLLTTFLLATIGGISQAQAPLWEDTGGNIIEYGDILPQYSHMEVYFDQTTDISIVSVKHIHYTPEVTKKLAYVWYSDTAELHFTTDGVTSEQWGCVTITYTEDGVLKTTLRWYFGFWMSRP